MVQKKMLKKQTAVAVFVKTPSISEVKTRLAKVIGQSRAIDFYLRSVRVIQKKLQFLEASLDIKPYWAVAEPEGLSSWETFPAVLQGNGGLGERLFQVQEMLFKDHDRVIFIGGDCPQIQTRQIEKAHESLRSGTDAIFIPAEDGGYALFGFTRPLLKETWTEVRYSSDKTLKEFTQALRKEDLDPIFFTQTFDIDDFKSLVQLKEKLDTEYAKDEILRDQMDSYFSDASELFSNSNSRLHSNS